MMELSYDNNSLSEHEKSELNYKRNSLQNSSGLFHNATSIISVTCSRDKQELEKATKLTGGESPTKSHVKVIQNKTVYLYPCQWVNGEDIGNVVEPN